MNQRKFLYLLLIKRWKKYFFINLLVLSCTFFYIETNAQKSLPRVKSFSVVTGYGNSVHTTVSRYNIIYLAGDFSQSFRKPYKLSFLSYYFEPQFNLVHAMEESLDIEFGVNGGIRNYIRINSDFYFYQMLG